ncbi:MAG: Ig-like domain repeat protein, partial [Thermoguttaceae bacterium]
MRRAAPHARRLGFEALEDRRLLAGLPGAALAHPDLVVSPDATGSSSPQSSWFTPAQIRQAYGISAIKFGSVPVSGDGSGTTIAVVDAYDQPNIVADLQQFDAQFQLPDPVFTRVSQAVGTALPPPDPSGGWGLETSLDVEWAHAIAPGAKILLVEATDATESNMFAAVDRARQTAGVVVVSLSWGWSEFFGENTYQRYLTTPPNHAGVTFFAATGDAGAPAEYPAVSPDVVAVGGTAALTTNGSGNYSSESGWYNSAGGISIYESQPSYQEGVVTQSTTKRTVPDVSWNAVNYAVCDSYDLGSATPWEAMDGTSAACPQWAALAAIADQGRAIAGMSPLDGLNQTLPALYSHATAGSFHDIVTGTSTGSPNYNAGPGYDLVTGLGSPVANVLIPQLVAAGLPVVTGISPAQGSAAGGTPVTITGTNLTGATLVDFGSQPATNVVVNSDSQITATSPAATVGTVDVTVVTPVTTSSVNPPADQFTYVLGNTSTTVTTAAGSSTYGAAVTLTASVTPSGAGAPTGTVTFFDNGSSLGTGTLNGSDIAAFTTSLLSAGSHPITASYGGDSSFAGSTSSPAVVWTVNKASLVITANNDSKTYGTLKTFAATAFTEVGLVTANGDTITGVPETSDGAALSATVASSPYTITIMPGSTTGTGLGNYTITCNTGLLTVSPKALTLTADNRTKTYGDSLAFAGTEFTPTGLVAANGDTVTGVTLTSPAAALSAGVAGSPYIITIIPGSAVFSPPSAAADYAITYNTGLLTVDQATPVFSNLTVPAIPAGTATATLSGTISLVPAGESISITLNGLTQTAPVDASGNFSSSFDTHALAAAGSPYTITYAYVGDANLTAASDASQTLIVDLAATAVAPYVTGGTSGMNSYGAPLSIPISAGPYGGIGSYDGPTAANA